MYADDQEGKIADSFNWVAGGLAYDDHPDNTNITYLVSGRKLVFLRKVNATAAGGGRTAAVFSVPARSKD